MICCPLSPFVCFMDVPRCEKLVRESETSQSAFEQVKRIASVFEEKQKKYTTNHWCNDFTFSIPKDNFVKDHHIAEENIRVDMSIKSITNYMYAVFAVKLFRCT